MAEELGSLREWKKLSVPEGWDVGAQRAWQVLRLEGWVKKGP